MAKYLLISLFCLLFILFLVVKMGKRSADIKLRAPFSGNAAPQKLTILFDLNGVLVNASSYFLGIHISPRHLTFMWELGPINFLKYLILARKSPLALSRAFYVLLDKVDPTSINSTGTRNNKDLLPGLMCDWLKGTKTGAEIEQMINDYLNVHEQEFMAIERLLFRKLAHALFDAHTYQNLCTVAAQAIEFAAACKARGYRIGILSNWDPASFALLQEKNPKLFNLFDEKDIFISGHMHLLKPDPAIYQEVLKHIDGVILFIDDQHENIEAAQKSGMQTFLFEAYDSADVKQLGKQLRIE